jgi:TonB family protein
MSSPTASSTSALISASSLGISVAAHALATLLAIYVPPPVLPTANNDPQVATRFLYPLMKPSPRPVQEHVSYVGLLGKGLAQPRATPKPTAATGTTTTHEEVAIAPPPETPVGSPDGIFTEIEVDLAAERDPTSEGPIYPDSMLARQIEGAARVRFIVDSTGHADVASFGVIETNESAFAEAVRMALPRMRFRPASIGETKVPQHVEQTFVFKITRPPVIP